MFEKKTLLATLAGFATMFVLGYLLYEVIFSSMLEEMMNPALAQFYTEMPNIVHMVLSNLVMAWAMCVVFSKGYEGGPGMGEGIRFGIWMWVLISIPMGLSFMAFRMMEFGQFLLEGLIYLIMLTLTGMVIGMVMGGSKAAAPAPAAPMPPMEV